MLFLFDFMNYTMLNNPAKYSVGYIWLLPQEMALGGIEKVPF